MTRDFDDDPADSPVVDADLPLFKTHHDWESGNDISATIIEAVSAVLGKEPTAIAPLYDVVDPDALDQLLASFRSDGASDEGRASVKFVFNGCKVCAESNGDIWIEPLDVRRSGVSVDS